MGKVAWQITPLSRPGLADFCLHLREGHEGNGRQRLKQSRLSLMSSRHICTLPRGAIRSSLPSPSPVCLSALAAARPFFFLCGYPSMEMPYEVQSRTAVHIASTR